MRRGLKPRPTTVVRRAVLARSRTWGVLAGPPDTPVNLYWFPEGRVIQRRLGKTDFEITTIGLGTWAIGGRQWGPQDDEASIGAIHAALDHGINWIDTAPFYGSGHSEEGVGRALKRLPTSRRPLVFTKFGLGLDVDIPVKSAAAKEVIDECEGSLRRLGVDRIDLFQLHWPAPQPIAETAGACAKLLAAGKVRAIGVSNFSVAELEEWKATGVPLHSDQPRTASCDRPRPTTCCRGAPRTTWA